MDIVHRMSLCVRGVMIVTCYMLHATKLSQESELFSHNNDSFEADTKLMDFAEKQKVFIFARGSRSAKSEECPNVSRPVEQFSVITAARA